MAALIAHVALDLADRGQLPASSFLLASTSFYFHQSRSAFRPSGVDSAG